MRRKLAYSNPVLTDAIAKLGRLPQGDWHVSKTGGKLFVCDTNWNTPLQDGLAKIVWEKADGGNLIGISDNDTVAIYPGVTVLVRLCGYEDASLVTMLKNLGLPLVFAASDHTY